MIEELIQNMTQNQNQLYFLNNQSTNPNQQFKHIISTFQLIQSML